MDWNNSGCAEPASNGYGGEYANNGYGGGETAGSYGGGNDGGCFNCGEQGQVIPFPIFTCLLLTGYFYSHIKSECPNPRVPRENNGACYNCGEAGLTLPSFVGQKNLLIMLQS